MATRKKPRSSSRDRLLKRQVPTYLEPKQFESLSKLSARTRVPMQVYLREGLDMVLARYATKGGRS